MRFILSIMFLCVISTAYADKYGPAPGQSREEWAREREQEIIMGGD